MTAPVRLTRRLLLGAAVTGAAGLAVACGRPGEPGPGASSGPGTPGASSAPASTTPPTTTTPSTPSSSAPETSRAPDCVTGLDLEQQIGQLMMVGVDSTGASADQLELIGRIGAGAVVMMGNNDQGVDAIRTVTDELRDALDPDAPALLVATDQEGGVVRRLSGPGFDEMPSAATQASWSRSTLRKRATTWAKQLRRAGVDSPLAPVADVVPPEIGNRNEPIAANDRGYGDDPDEVAERIDAVVTGLRSGGMATALKHFPGLGRVIGNTDFASDVVDDRTGPDDPLWGSFLAGMEAGSDMVMMATARYTKLDPSAPAAFSSEIISDLLRGDLGWDRVVISDDLGVAKQVADLEPGERAVRFLKAGGDIVINVDPSSVGAMVKAVLAAARKSDRFAEQIAVKAERVLRMKADRGLVSC